MQEFVKGNLLVLQTAKHHTCEKSEWRCVRKFLISLFATPAPGD